MVTTGDQNAKLAFLFPGQGSQYVGMGAHLVETHKPAAELLERADKALGFELSKIILEGPEEQLTQTEHTQPAIMTISVAVAQYLFEHNIRPDVMAGHSLGEYSALVVAGALEFEDALRLLYLRGKAMQEAVPAGTGSMAAIIGLDNAEVEGFCQQVAGKGQVVEPAGYNCPKQVVVSGHKEAVKQVVELASKARARCVELKVSAPFHCSLLKPAEERLRAALAEVEFSTPNIPYVANVNAELGQNSDSVAEMLAQQVCKPVLWAPSLLKILTMRVQRFIEVGPGKVCVGHLRKVDRRKGSRAALFAVTDQQTDLDGVIREFT